MLTQFLEGREKVLGHHDVERRDNEIVITRLAPAAIAATFVEELGWLGARALVREIAHELEVVR